MQKSTCCITGHRLFEETKLDYISSEIRREIEQAFAEGYDTFLSGFALGADLLFAGIVAELKNEHPILLEAAIPYRGRLKTHDRTFQRLLSYCDAVHVCSEVYHPGCFMKRNRFMVDRSSRIIAVYDGRENGGTFATMQYARKTEKMIRVICV